MLQMPLATSTALPFFLHWYCSRDVEISRDIVLQVRNKYHIQNKPEKLLIQENPLEPLITTHNQIF